MALVHVWTNGDTSVGIEGGSTMIEIEGYEFNLADPDEKERRETLRRNLVEAFSDFYGEKAHAMYEDEIPQEPEEPA